MLMEILVLLLIPIGIVLITAVVLYFSFCYETKAEKARIADEKRRKTWTAYNLSKQGFEDHKKKLFNNPINYAKSCDELLSFVKQMKVHNSEFVEEEPDNELEIASFLRFVEKLRDFGITCKELVNKNSMLMSEYGKVNIKYYNYISNLEKVAVDNSVKQVEEYMRSKKFDNLVEKDPRILLDAMWFYAINKPFSLNDFEKAKKIINVLCPGSLDEIQWFIAEAYAINQMGGSNVLRNKINELLKNRRLSVEELSSLASSFMWMKAYNEEAIVLNYMLSNKMPMTAKLQERLHALSNGGGNAPVGYDVVSSDYDIYVDVSSLSWQDKEYQGFFENLIFQDKELSYSLAIRDEDKDLFISKGFSIPKIDDICKKVSELFEEEFGSETRVKKVQFNALSGNDIEKMEGFLAVTDACKQLGIFVHIARIGKKLNIKFYTLYMPEKEQVSNQKQKVMSIYKKINPIINMWENTLIETILLAIQQILNSIPTSNETSETSEGAEVEF